MEDEVTLLFLEPRATFDAFIVGLLVAIDQDSDRVIYNKDAIIEHLTKEMLEADESLDRDDALTAAVEHFDYNIAGGWVGPQTPVFSL